MNSSKRGLSLFSAIFLLFILIILGLVIYGLVTSSNSTQEAMNSQSFKEFMEKKGYAVTDVTGTISDSTYASRIYCATSADEKYSIYFYEFSDNTYSSLQYSTIKANFDLLKDKTYKRTSVNRSNNERYTLQGNGKYYAVTRIEKTVVSVETDSTYAKKAKSIMKKLGY